ncbi:MAG TPA: RNA polymerase sigma factor [Acidimicrobiia bacterium]|nr:RNA polymerase sigma factor [Acidimicrobiia bacterium]
MNNERSDDELLVATGSGDREAFELFYRRNAPWLEVRLRRRCADSDMVVDVLQETFLAVWRAAGSYRGSGRSAAWLWTIASHRVVDAYRRRAVRPKASEEAEDFLVSAPSAEDVALISSLDVGLVHALERLSPELRAVLQATVLDGLSIRETAVLLDVSEGTVKSRAFRARHQVREALT